jgi:hypothetical protein
MSKPLDIGEYKRLKQVKLESVFRGEKEGEIHPNVQFLLSLRPLMWEGRGNMLTGSDFADALNRGYPYPDGPKTKPLDTRTPLMHRKVTGEQKKVWGANVDWGTKHEPLALEAMRVWLERNGKGTLHHLGTMSHAMIHGREEGTNNDRLGGTIDACTSQNWLIEAKCLAPDMKKTTRNAQEKAQRQKYHTEVVPYYMDQIQGYLWVYGFDAAYFIQYFWSPDLRNPDNPHLLHIIEVKKDENWEATNRPLLEGFVDEWDKKKGEREDKILNFFK